MSLYLCIFPGLPPYENFKYNSNYFNKFVHMTYQHPYRFNLCKILKCNDFKQVNAFYNNV